MHICRSYWSGHWPRLHTSSICHWHVAGRHWNWPNRDRDCDKAWISCELSITLYGQICHIYAYFSVHIELCYLGPSPMFQEFNSIICGMLTWSFLRTQWYYLLPYMAKVLVKVWYLCTYVHISLSPLSYVTWDLAQCLKNLILLYVTCWPGLF